MSVNPYSPPKAALEAHGSGEYRRDGKDVVLRPGSALPPRCVKCNEPAILPMKARKVYWHHWGWYLLVFANIVIYVVVALIIRRKAEVTYGVCAGHRLRRRAFIAIGVVGVTLGALLIGPSPVLAITMILACLLAGVVGSRLVHATRVTKEEVRLAGCGEAFLASLERTEHPPAPKLVPPVGRAGLGSCPKCSARLPIDAPSCLKCKTVLSPGTVLPLRA